MMFALTAVVVVVLAAGLLVGIDGFRTLSAVDEARHENITLRAQQKALRDQGFELAERSIEVVARGQRMVRLTGASRRTWKGEGSPLPARNAGNEVLLDWLSEQQVILAALEKEMVAGHAEAGRVIATVPTPASTVTGPTRNAPLLQSAQMNSIQRKKTSPPRR